MTFIFVNNLKVHKAILLPLCPNLSTAAQDLNPEDPEELTVLLPGVSTQDVVAFLRILYQGYCVLSSPSLAASEVKAVLDLMVSFGLHSPASSWTVEVQDKGHTQKPEPFYCNRLKRLEVVTV